MLYIYIYINYEVFCSLFLCFCFLLLYTVLCWVVHLKPWLSVILAQQQSLPQVLTSSGNMTEPRERSAGGIAWAYSLLWCASLMAGKLLGVFFLFYSFIIVLTVSPCSSASTKKKSFPVVTFERVVELNRSVLDVFPIQWLLLYTICVPPALVMFSCRLLGARCLTAVEHKHLLKQGPLRTQDCFSRHPRQKNMLLLFCLFNRLLMYAMSSRWWQ